MKKVYTQWISEVWSNGGNSELAKSIISDSFVDHSPHKSFGKDKNGHISMAEDWNQKFSNIELSIEDIIISGDKLVGRYTGELTSKSGEKKYFSEIDIIKIENNQIVEWWHNDDIRGI